MSYIDKARIGEEALFRTGGFIIPVTITDYKVSYGKERWLVKPTAGTGEVWVEQIITK